MAEVEVVEAEVKDGGDSGAEAMDQAAEEEDPDQNGILTRSMELTFGTL